MPIEEVFIRGYEVIHLLLLYYDSHFYPVVRAQQCNYATLLYEVIIYDIQSDDNEQGSETIYCQLIVKDNKNQF